MSWNEGYLSEIGYVYDYHQELNPLRIRLGFAMAGIVPPTITTAAELGFGQGVSVVMHGAAADVEWYANDFSPAQAGFAIDLASESGVPVHLTDESFADFCARPDLPDFDFIALHGIWTWVSQANREIIVDFLKRKLRVGGVAYLSYNALPGWAGNSPLRHMLAYHDERLGAPGQGVTARVETAMAFMDRLFEAKPQISSRSPSVRERYLSLRDKPASYLAHEFFNKNWQPFYFSQVAEALEPAKLGFACSASFIDPVNALHLTEAQQDMLETIADPLLQETVRDFMINRGFRKEYWVKGARRFNNHDHGAMVRGIPVVLTVARGDVVMKVAGALGEMDLGADTYGPILDLLADNLPKTIGHIEAALPSLRLGMIMQALLVLAGMAVVTVASEPAPAQVEQAQRLNGSICRRAIGSTELGHLASPVTGGGIEVSRFDMLFLLALAEGRKTPKDLAEYLWAILASQGQRLNQGGKPVDSEAENIALLTGLAQTFVDTGLPKLQALRVI